MRELIDGETMDEFLLVEEPIGKDIRKGEGDEEDERQQVY